MMRRLPLSLLLLSCALLLPACETAAVAVATPIAVQKRHVNLPNAVYAATDSLIQHTSVRLDRNAPIFVYPLEEIDHGPKEGEQSAIPRRKVHPNPNLGKAMTNRMRTRLRELGYIVVQGAAPVKGGYSIRGIYDVHGGNFLDLNQKMKVTLQLSETDSDRIINEHDFFVPVTDEVREHMDSGNILLPKVLRD